MRQVVEGIDHWTAPHPRLGFDVSSYYLPQAAALLDPVAPADGIEALTELPVRPRRIILSNRHHRRDAERIAELLDCPIRVPAPGMHAWAGVERARGYAFGEEVAPGVEAIEIGVLAPDEAALAIAAGTGAIAFGDTLIRQAGALAFVDDHLIGDDPEGVKAGLRAAFERLLERDFDALLFAHGEPLVSGGQQALRGFIRQRGA